MQTCDWPHVADCSNKEGQAEGGEPLADDESVYSEEDDKLSNVQSANDVGDEGTESTGG